MNQRIELMNASKSLGQNIVKLINEYEEKTGLCVKKLRINRSPYTDDNNLYVATSVDVDVRL